MSRVRTRRLHLGVFGSVVLLGGANDAAVSRMGRIEGVDCHELSDGPGGFVAVGPSEEIYVWINQDKKERVRIVAHEALHATLALFRGLGIELDVNCAGCEELLAAHVGYITDEITLQLKQWQL